MQDLMYFRLMLLLSIPTLHVCCVCAKKHIINLVQEATDEWLEDKEKDETLKMMIRTDNELREQEFGLLTNFIKVLWTGIVCLLNIISLFI